MKNLVSVIMSTFNEDIGELTASIDSILNQTYKNLELVVVIDNPENKNIKSVIEMYIQKEKRIKVIYNETNIGLAKSLNKAIHLASGEFIARMDADDISFPNRLEKEVDYLKAFNLDMVASNRIDINEEGEKLPRKSKLPKTESVDKILPVGNFITHPTIIIKASTLKKVNGYRDFQSSQDYDLWLRILSEGYKIGILDEPLLYYKVREESISKKDKFRQYLLNKYQKGLYHNRLLNGKDDFSHDNLNMFLNKHKYFDEDNRKQFNSAYKKFELGIINIKRKHYFNGAIQIMYALKEHKEIVKCMIDNLKYQIMCKKYS